MKRYVTDKWFWVALVLVGVIAGRALTSAFAQDGGWREPTAPPPFGQPTQPLDTSSVSQTKPGDLTVNNLVSRQSVRVGIELGNDLHLQGSTGQILFDRTALGSSGRAAISFRPDENGNWVLQATHNDRIANGWFTLGTGSSGATGGSGAFWRATTGGTPGIVTDGRVGVGTGSQNLVSMLHVKAQSATSPVTQGLTIQGSQDAFQSQYAARLFMHGTDFRILRTTTNVDDGLTIRSNGDLVAGRGLEVKETALLPQETRFASIGALNHATDLALTLDDTGRVRLARVASGGGSGCDERTFYYTYEIVDTSAGRSQKIVTHVGLAAAGFAGGAAGSGGTSVAVGTVCAGRGAGGRSESEETQSGLTQAVSESGEDRAGVRTYDIPWTDWRLTVETREAYRGGYQRTYTFGRR